MISPMDIRVVNPRKRDPKKYKEIINSIETLGLKIPIVVAPRTSANDDKHYDLVCGEGRLDAFIKANEEFIPARILEAEHDDVLLMSLAENIARRQPNKLSILKEIIRLVNEGYSISEISKKIGVSETFISHIRILQNKANPQLLRSVILGKIPPYLAVEIVCCSKDEEVQKLLNDAYNEKQIKINELRTIKKVLEKHNKKSKNTTLTKEQLISNFKRTARKSREFLSKVEVCDVTLAFIRGAFSKMLKNDGFRILLEAEGFKDLPAQLENNL